MKKSITLSFIVGLAIGATLFGGTAAFAASGILADLERGQRHGQHRHDGGLRSGGKQAIGTWPGYRLTSISPYGYRFTSNDPAAYEEAAAYCRPFIDSLNGLSDREKVRQIAFFISDRLTYEAGSTSSPRTALVDDAVHKGNCMSYSHNFLFLCDMAGIPCVFQHSDIHQWNEVYVEGKWRKGDVTSVDCGDDAVFRVRSSVLWDDDYVVTGSSFRPAEPEVTEFVKEILVPGSICDEYEAEK